MKKILVNAQWQGGADLSTFEGAQELKKLYLAGMDPVILPVSTDIAEMGAKKNGIRGFDVLRGQMQAASALLRKTAPDQLFTLGGGCDADVPGIVYLNEKYQGDLTVLWLDAHGDLNAPDESTSSLFYGMPLRSLMDKNCFGLLENPFPLNASQIIHIGGRDFDHAETEFIKRSAVSTYSVEDIHSGKGSINRIFGELPSDHVYIHLDLDVTDPADFPNTPLPVAGGLRCGELYDILDAVRERLAGVGIFEYSPCGVRSAFIENLIRFGLTL